eukprot:7316902-Pyramimonas_sp.AAC.1
MHSPLDWSCAANVLRAQTTFALATMPGNAHQDVTNRSHGSVTTTKTHIQNGPFQVSSTREAWAKRLPLEGVKHLKEIAVPGDAKSTMYPT